ncbi:hypothetical protein ACHAXA_001183 [Cyclostephanos tholiformis]|jgi:hypothetical protein|uniref:Uncharacterized protein n=1 Tax=Cyclostephanos tholiformis TaxID=382380 RepID=A0ABD3RSJ1_9STRA
MKLVHLAVPFIGVASTAEVAPTASISASSSMGQQILSRARKLEDDNAEIDYTWVANMSLKYQGCYHTQVWNGNVDASDDVRVSTQRLVRFRLCPSDSCSMTNAAGCGAGYGDYVIGMETYLEAYLEAVQQDHEYNCEYEKNYGKCAACEDADNKEYCEYDCYVGKGMEYCVDRNPYDEDNGNQQQQEMDLGKIAEGCQQFKVNNNQQSAYYLGAYCSANGGSIHLGLFTDDTCSAFADESGGANTYLSLVGSALPYSDTTLIGTECMSCKEPKDVNQNGQNDQYDADEVKESCETLYAAAGKCESALATAGTVTNPNNNACNFMQGIKIVRKNGSIVRGAGTQNAVATTFIGLFACSFVLAGGYVYYLRLKLDRARINLSE